MMPAESMNVAIDVFEGPMDLLLYLIRKNNLDIYDIPIAQITKEYLGYLEVMKELNLDVAGEFLVMASTLMQIKAKTLLPSQAETTGDEGPDPAAELINKITEYQKYKEAAQFLDKQFDRFKDIFYRGSPMFQDAEKVLNLELFELLEAVKRAMDRIEEKAPGREVHAEQFPIETRMEKILSLLGEREWILLDDVFSGETKKMGVITCFMALLELLKLHKILARQDKALGEIRVYRRAEPGAEPPPERQGAQTVLIPDAKLGENLLFSPAIPDVQPPAENTGQQQPAPGTTDETTADEAATATQTQVRAEVPAAFEPAQPQRPAETAEPPAEAETAAEQAQPETEPAAEINTEQLSQPAAGRDTEQAKPDGEN
jgi:segregation and condensation protein A